jgi:hypothetical protein
MGAFADHNQKGHFVLREHAATVNAVGAWRGSFFHEFPAWEPELDNRRRSWSVCPHLSTLEGLFDYYMASGSIMILLGKCFCHDCYEMVLSRKDLNGFMDSCRHMTDKRFQEEFIDPLFLINKEVFRTRRDAYGQESTRWTWVSCPHVAGEGRLEELYTRCGPIFFYEGFVSCAECNGVLPSASLYLQTLLDCEAMTDDQLQDRVIAPLYPINRGALEAVGHYSRR